MGKWGHYIKVNPGEIREGADAAEEIGDTLRKQVDFARNESHAAAAANPGFDAGDMLMNAVETWEENWRKIAESVSGVSDKLRTCAGTYDQSDQRGASTFDGITARLG